jgi:hypothetical protein
MCGIPEWLGYVINPTPAFAIGKAVGGDTGIAVVDPAMYLASNAERQKKRQEAEQKALTRTLIGSTPEAPSPFTLYTQPSTGATSASPFERK